MAKKSYFGSKHTRNTAGSKLLAGVTDFYNRTGNPLKNISGKVFSMEGLNEVEQTNIDTGVDEIENGIDEIITTQANEQGVAPAELYTQAQKDAAIAAGVAAAAPESFLDNTETSTASAVAAGAVAPGELGDMTEYPEGAVITTESFSTAENKNTFAYSVTYNLRAARQNEFGEAFFPTVTVEPNVASITVSADLIGVFEETKRNIDGTIKEEMFGQKSVIQALAYPEILSNDTTLAIPVYREDNETSVANFVDAADVAPHAETLENGESIQTAPLKIGSRFDLIGLSSADYLIEAGMMDQSDQLDPSVQLKAIYVKLADGSVIKFGNLQYFNDANFTYAQQDNSRGMNLQFNNYGLGVSPKTTLVDGSALPDGNAVTANDVTVNLRVSVTGQVNLNDATTIVNAGNVEVYNAFDENGTKVDLTGTAGQAIVSMFAGATIIGYDLIARRINANRLERGQLMDINTNNMVYGIPYLAPITWPRATGAGTDDATRLDGLVQSTYVRTSNAAVDTLLGVDEHLSALAEDYEPEKLYKQRSLGVGRFFVKAYYQALDLDVQEEMNNLTSNARLEDVRAVILNAVSALVNNAVLNSNYKAAKDMLYGEAEKTQVVIGTDPFIANYLYVSGDVRTLGDQYDVKIVSTVNKKMKNKIFITIGSKQSATSGSTFNPLHFGNMYWRPGLSTSLQITRAGRTSYELTVQPSFRHVCHLPILLRINVMNMAEAISKVQPLLIKES